MGFLDKFKKKNKQEVKSEINDRKEMERFNLKYEITSNDNLQIEFYDENADFKKFYDTTKLIISRQPLNIEGHRVYNCAVSWYGHNDCQVLNKRTGELESPRAQEFKGVLAEIDLELLQSDQYYCNMVMDKLLDKQRVEEYLERGLQETPDRPCGKYIGGIMQTERGYGKFFSAAVGRASHNSEQMKNRRQEYRKKREMQRQKTIEDKKTQIKKLQSEIDSMEI